MEKLTCPQELLTFEGPGNTSMVVTEFIILGFGDLKELSPLFVLVFGIIYLATISGNLLLVVLVSTQRGLQTPMYFFLATLSCLEICYTSNIVPRMLVDFLRENRVISMTGCIIQLYFFGALGSTECYLLAVMSYDRYLAVCQPLHYPTLMNGTICVRLIIGSWVSGFTVAAVFQATMVSTLTFCDGNEIDHFFCDLKPLQKLSRSDPHLVNLICMSLTVLVTLAPFGLTLASYWRILSVVLQIPSVTGRQKAFSTCSSHLVVVTLFYGTLILVYAVPLKNQVPALNKAFSLLYTVVTPMCNPLIYSLKNKDVKEALKKLSICCYDEFYKSGKNDGSLKVKAKVPFSRNSYFD
ncbi:olfactory receptor 10A7 [Tupaia chinensis]|uniref:Olfactory receptor n=1 Tax=Tupaia chinensis TaxID=246437 RepID=L8Y6K4_TUPCH|nr:olfactory receptor 10A7 [Tupaia chinensis]ELV11897.1 Olfactory receptor 10A7 [Tupaia chinensis]